MDSEGLTLAYQSAQGTARIGNTLYIRGTDWSHGAGRLAADVRDDMRLPLSNVAGWGGVRNTDKYRQVKRLIEADPSVEEIVGHSLGAAVAQALGDDTGRPYRAYGSPSVTWQRNPRHRRHFWDPVSILDRGASSSHFIPTGNPHGFH